MTQLEKNIAFCIDECNMDDEQIGDILRCIERENVPSVEHFFEEFVFICYDAVSYTHLTLPTIYSV